MIQLDGYRVLTLADATDAANRANIDNTGAVKVQGIASGVTSGEVTQLVADGKMFNHANIITQDSSGTDNPLYYIKNPSGSGKILYLWEIMAGVTAQNQYSIIKLYANPTVTTDGTSKTPVNRLVGSSATADMEIYEIPTITNEGNLLITMMYPENGDTAIYPAAFSIQVKPENSILITGDPKGNNDELALHVAWAEEDEST